MFNIKKFLLTVALSPFSAFCAIASIESDQYPMSTVFYLSDYTSEQSEPQQTLWEQFPHHRKSQQVKFKYPDTKKKLVIISHAPGASRYAHSWLVPSLVEKDMIVACIEHRFFNIHERDFKELYSNVLARPVEIDIMAKNISKDDVFGSHIQSNDISIISVDDSSIAAILLGKGQLESLKLKEHQQRYALWNLWGPSTSKEMAQVDWTSQTVMPTDINYSKFILLNPRGKKAFYAQSLNKIKSPVLIISQNRVDIDNFHEEIEYLTTHITNSQLKELPQGSGELIFYSQCGQSSHPLLHPKCLEVGNTKQGIQKEIVQDIVNFIEKL